MKWATARLIAVSARPSWHILSRGPLVSLSWAQKPRLRREFGFEAIPSVLVPPVVFGGLLVTLWTYKCLMMVVFQNKIIYMPSVPPFSRSEKVAEYAAQCKPVEWREHDLKATDGTALKLLEGSVDRNNIADAKRLVVVYLQGNASSLPPRLPYLSSILKSADLETSNISIVALSYRGFWSSKGSPSQAGIELDAEAALRWSLERYDSGNTRIVIWGQSIGAGVACVSLAGLIRHDPIGFRRIRGLLLETPFVDLKAMLVALYPQRFLPYRYLTPFLQSIWDSKTALEQIGDTSPDLKVKMLQAGDDEIVPDGQAEQLEEVCHRKGVSVERHVIAGALHTDVMMKGQGKRQIVGFLKSFL